MGTRKHTHSGGLLHYTFKIRLNRPILAFLCMQGCPKDLCPGDNFDMQANITQVAPSDQNREWQG